jgi:hypothetical protein
VILSKSRVDAFRDEHLVVERHLREFDRAEAGGRKSAACGRRH